ncbi:uncharacterized protein LOC128553958, partial [Mercenaria mercenaria]|uniref:uncharacterized protein LOC128553958 n=1 Tax=Mercenaria mercenaria TaxID=6596 RepID=UPI00234E49F4
RYVPEEELPDSRSVKYFLSEISDVAKIENELTLDEVNSKLTPLEEMSDDHQALEKPVEREQIERTEPVQETGSTQNLTEMKKEQFAPRTKILADDESLEKDPRGSLERFGSYSILDVNVEHAVGKTFGTFLSNQPDKQRAAEEEAAFEAVILSPHFAYQVTGRSTEESQVARSLLEGSLQDYFSKSTNDSSKRVKNNLATLAPQTPHLPVIVSENHFIQTKLQSPHLHFSWKVPSVSATVSPVPPNPETNPYDPALLQTQVQQDMLVPTENSQIDGFSPNYPNKVITEQKRLSGVLDSSPAQTGCGNPQVPLHMGQQLYSSSGQNSKPLDGFANISSRLPPDKPQCSPSVRCSLKMKLKKHSTGERHQPYTLDKKSNNDLLPNLDEIHTPF